MTTVVFATHESVSPGRGKLSHDEIKVLLEEVESFKEVLLGPITPTTSLTKQKRAWDAVAYKMCLKTRIERSGKEVKAKFMRMKTVPSDGARRSSVINWIFALTVVFEEYRGELWCGSQEEAILHLLYSIEHDRGKRHENCGEKRRHDKNFGNAVVDLEGIDRNLFFREGDGRISEKAYPCATEDAHRTRAKEHIKDAINYRRPIGKHFNTDNHEIFDLVILPIERVQGNETIQRKVREDFWIKKLRPSINKAL
ncbi:unnamed protein product [Darwinula stevensoni]|uniref:Regulatory protein zeste n=1 Tax=Darwinula stevensoni TaxID=69355 RepID=A0A7R9AGI1_9CRUS|nr:unnamed protein product [Darwinula stevensoni]CAG0904064.1 unnamed protein product [Darwinula stevensoni]